MEDLASPAQPKRPAAQAHTASKVQRVAEQQQAPRFEPRVTRSATKAKREAGSPKEVRKVFWLNLLRQLAELVLHGRVDCCWLSTGVPKFLKRQSALP